jgi:PAS domain S-box-containing protein
MSKFDKNNLFLIAVGASAGGLEAISDFLIHFPKDLESFCIIIAQHLSPIYRSRLVEILTRQTSLPVQEAVNGLALESGRVYITPPDSEITIQFPNIIRLNKPGNYAGPKPSVDILFHSIAHIKKEKAIAVILSGTGSDGSKGMMEVKKKQGLTIVQRPDSARYRGMPDMAIETGSVSAILSTSEMGEFIRGYIHSIPQEEMEVRVDFFSNILKILSEFSGVDFFKYRKRYIQKKILSRQNALGLKSLEDYHNFIRSQSEEISTLFYAINNPFTSKFINFSKFEPLEEFFNKLISTKKSQDSIRIWNPGCATGEEAYSIGIFLRKLIVNSNKQINFQVFGTDINETFIHFARLGNYEKSSLEELPEEFLEEAFSIHGENWEVKKTIKSSILFSKHDITIQPPFLKLDLIICRNLINLLDSLHREKIFNLFYASLNPHGLLITSNTEILSRSNLFERIGKYDLYRKKVISYQPKPILPYRIPNLFGTDIAGIKPRKSELSELVYLNIVKHFNFPYVLLNDNLDIQELFGDVSSYFKINPGVVDPNIKKFLHNQFQIDFLDGIQKIKSGSSGYVSSWKVFSNSKNSERIARLRIIPFFETGKMFYILLFEEKEQEIITHTEGETKTVDFQVISELESELNKTKQTLQTVIEELETSNEELQATNEELMSTNEELQATNEELETSNEELMSTNEELQSAYSELRCLNKNLEDITASLKLQKEYLRILLDTSFQSYILIDTNYCIREFNKKAAQIAEMVFEKKMEIGVSIFDFILPGDMEDFKRNLKKAFEGRIIDVEKKISIKDDHRWFRFNYVPINHQLDKIEHVVFASYDITDKKKYSEFIENSNLKLEKLVKERTRELEDTNTKLQFSNREQEKLIQELQKYQRELKLSEEKYILLSEHVPDSDLLLYSKSLELLVASGFQLFKKKWAEIDYKNKKLTELFNENLNNLLLPVLQSSLEGEEGFSELVNDGDIFSVQSFPIKNEKNEILAGMCVIQNITNTRLWEIQSKYNESIIDLFFEEFIIGIAIINQSGNIIRANNKFKDLFLIGESSKVTDKKIWDYFSQEKRDSLQRSIIAQFESLENVKYEDEINRNGTTIYLDVGRVLFNNVDHNPYLLIYAVDITERKNNELKVLELNKGLEEKVAQELQKNREKDHILIAQSRMASMGEMIGNIAHQWRQPLSSISVLIQNFTDSIRFQEITEKELEVFEAKSKNIIQFMSRTIDDFRNFFKPVKGKEKCFIIKDCLEKALLLIENTIRNNNIQIIKDWEEDVQLESYPGELVQVLLNLMNNSIEAFQDKRIANRVISISFKNSDPIQIRIIDNAGGIDPSKQQKIFDPYFTTKENGTGVGLYMSKMIVEKSMHGKIQYFPIENGSEFVIEFPKELK